MKGGRRRRSSPATSLGFLGLTSALNRSPCCSTRARAKARIIDRISAGIAPGVRRRRADLGKRGDVRVSPGLPQRVLARPIAIFFPAFVVIRKIENSGDNSGQTGRPQREVGRSQLGLAPGSGHNGGDAIMADYFVTLRLLVQTQKPATAALENCAKCCESSAFACGILAKKLLTHQLRYLQSRKVGFPDSGFDLGYPQEVFPPR